MNKEIQNSEIINKNTYSKIQTLQKKIDTIKNKCVSLTIQCNTISTTPNQLSKAQNTLNHNKQLLIKHSKELKALQVEGGISITVPGTIGDYFGRHIKNVIKPPGNTRRMFESAKSSYSPCTVSIKPSILNAQNFVTEYEDFSNSKINNRNDKNWLAAICYYIFWLTEPIVQRKFFTKNEKKDGKSNGSRTISLIKTIRDNNDGNMMLNVLRELLKYKILLESKKSDKKSDKKFDKKASISLIKSMGNDVKTEYETQAKTLYDAQLQMEPYKEILNLLGENLNNNSSLFKKHENYCKKYLTNNRIFKETNRILTEKLIKSKIQLSKKVGVYEKKLDKALNNIYSFFTTCDNFQTSMIEMTDAIATHLSLNGVNCNVDLNGSITKMIDPPPKLVLPKSDPSNSS